ncbi:MAG TPA: hypothetical protein P5248_05555, partial [Bacteroidales bacterium]|nr:hypothetical protein [Bacteroidales bacterium]
MDSIHPAEQEVCLGSNDIQRLEGCEGYDLQLLRLGNPTSVFVNPGQFQWQFSTDSLAWTDIDGAVKCFYQPEPAAVTRWFRRLMLDGTSLAAISSVSKVAIRSDIAPTVDPGANLYLCPGAYTQLGGFPTASGGFPPYTYEWSPATGLNDPFIANPIVTPSDPITGYTVRVVDANLCSQKEQVVVEVITADAGPDVQLCPGEQALLKAPGYPGASNVGYLWEALNGSGNASILTPLMGHTLVSPTQNTTYVVHVSDGGFPGGTCPSDTVEVRMTSLPVADAGPDQFTCEDQGVSLGNGNLPGHIYVWSPGAHLSGTLGPYTSFDGYLPVDQPGLYRKYILTAIREDALCAASYDTVNVFVGFAYAGIDGCGPRPIGYPDFTGGLASYSWEVLEGDTASILGQEHLADPFVDPDTTTIYQVTVVLNGATCTDMVVVPPCGCPLSSDHIKIPIRCRTAEQEIPYLLEPRNLDTFNYTYEWWGADTSLL